ncbi:GTP pyrophosphokinase [Pseudoalteromonas maricaloris]|uniref:GTP pyrophosphokinase n=1 Tax=Pseudoalteromonas maricaloris TaxID=184924 RepID=UPI00029A6236|nr:GTP pyrophosphokinase [Pseudoalteromonas flavipulchra]
MSETSHHNWIDNSLPLHKRLTESVVTIIENLLKSQNIDYLAVSGRTKDRKSALEKIKRKGYKDPSVQMTDLSGIRIILYFESDVEKVSKLIEQSFCVDSENSLNQDDLMSSDQIGYRSVHFVCDLGEGRGTLPEFSGLANLKFEFQVRTVLQHAWAELAHDRNYKLAGKLPTKLERQLYLYAGMLEIADRGFDEISSEIDKYIEQVDKKSDSGDLDLEIDSISLKRFVQSWAEKEDLALNKVPKNYNDEVINELSQFGINSLEELNALIPSGYAEAMKRIGYSSNLLGVVRDWMVINNFRKFHEDVEFNWVYETRDLELLKVFLSESDMSEFIDLYRVMDPDDEPEDYYE